MPILQQGVQDPAARPDDVTWTAMLDGRCTAANLKAHSADCCDLDRWYYAGHINQEGRTVSEAERQDSLAARSASWAAAKAAASWL